ncbi:hypothetical protein Pint_19064 [Pistacia integerrima]|uniref:Uncharacterized protein n=1 Tax=Pistacia integerrima TaxID=434235 RepID=A0ACC0YX92_9ROSI|nr:hypothetical protein Pint_19064 [Pistacia integerrima]
MASTNSVKIQEVSKVTPNSDSTTEFSLPLTFFDIFWFKFHPVERLYQEVQDLSSKPTCVHGLLLSGSGSSLRLFLFCSSKSASTFSFILSTISSDKLDRTNYPLWETLVLPVIRGHKSVGYIFGTKPCPPEYLPRTTPGSAVKIPNPDYEDRISNDQLLLGWLYSTMNLDMASQLMQELTSKELWDAAKELSSAHTKSRVIYYKGELQKTRKGGMKMEEYLTTMKAFSDNLTVAGSPISLSDLITQILSGLDAEYTLIVVQLSDKESLSWIEL